MIRQFLSFFPVSLLLMVMRLYVCEYMYYCWQCLLSKSGDSKEIGGIWMNIWDRERRKSVDQLLFIGSLKCEGLENVRSVKLTYVISVGGHQSQPQAVNYL